MECRLSCRARLSPRCVHPCLCKSWNRGCFSAPAADSEHLLLCTAAPVANKFYGAMAWLGFYSFCKPKTGNMQSKMHMCIVFDIHREHSCLLPGAGDDIAKPSVVSSVCFQRNVDEDMILSAILARSQLLTLPSTAEVGSVRTYF